MPPFLADHVKTHIRFLDILGTIKGQYPFYYRSAENMSQTPIWSASTKKKSQSLRHLLQSAEGSSLMTYTCTFRLWLLYCRMIMNYDSRVLGHECKKEHWRFEIWYGQWMGIATCINHLIIRSCSCWWEWPNYSALVGEDGRNSVEDTHLLSTGYFIPHDHKGSHFVQMVHVGFNCHSFFFCVCT